MFNSAADTEKSFHLQGPKTGPRGPTAAASTLSNPIISFYIKLPLVQLYPLISQVSNPLCPPAALTVNICLFFGEKTHFMLLSAAPTEPRRDTHVWIIASQCDETSICVFHFVQLQSTGGHFSFAELMKAPPGTRTCGDTRP